MLRSVCLSIRPSHAHCQQEHGVPRNVQRSIWQNNFGVKRSNVKVTSLLITGLRFRQILDFFRGWSSRWLSGGEPRFLK